MYARRWRIISLFALSTIAFSSLEWAVVWIFCTPARVQYSSSRVLRNCVPLSDTNCKGMPIRPKILLIANTALCAFVDSVVSSSTYRVKESMHTRIYWCPLDAIGSGPMVSI